MKFLRQLFCSDDVLFSFFFFHLCLFDGTIFHYGQVLVIFLLSKRRFPDLAALFHLLFLFFLFHYQHGTFLWLNLISLSWFYIFIVCFRVSSSFNFWQISWYHLCAKVDWSFRVIFSSYLVTIKPLCTLPSYKTEWYYCYNK